MKITQNNKTLNRIAALALSICMIFVTAISASAEVAFAGGSGTKSDPYLVATAEQFNAIRNNLSAHYKLSNTIDLSSIANFTPIGNMERPFSGSLSCDLGSDGFPLYAVKNLTVKVAKTDYIAEKKNKWEAAAFGAAKEAEFTNIYMLNVMVSNDNFGDNTGNVVYGNYKPGMDEMCSAGLVGFAEGCTVTGCMTSGKIETSSNICGGLIGSSEGSTIANSYSSASVITVGKYSVGGLIGTLADSTLTNSCYLGAEVSCGSQYDRQGMLFGSASDCVISDCYAKGKGLTCQANLGQMNSNVTMTNCYSSAVISAAVPDNYIGKTTGVDLTNVYVIDTCGNISICKNIPKASAAEIKSAFSGLKGWNTDGELPTLTAVKVLTDESRYVPGATTQQSDNSNGISNSTVNSGVSSNSGDISSDITEEVSVEDIVKMAEALPDADKLSAKNIMDVLNAKDALDNLSDGEYAQLDSAVANKIQECYKAIQPIMLEYLVSELENLDVDKIKPADKEKILELKTMYDKLEESTKEAFSSVLLEKLNEAVEKVESMDDSDAVSGSFSTSEKIVLILLSSIAVLIFAANIVLIVIVIRKKRILDALCLETENDAADIADAGDSI